MPHTTQSVLVLGGGYAGVMAANRVAGRLGTKAQVTLVSERNEFVHRIRLHEALAGRAFKRYAMRSVLSPRVRLVHGRVRKVGAATRTVTVEGHGTLAYDALLVALGSKLSFAVPGVAEHAGWLASPESAAAGAEQLASLGDGAPVVVVGGGLTAVETASEIAEAHPRLKVTMLASHLAPGLSDAGRAYLRETLGALGVRLREGTRVARIAADAVELDGGERVASALTVWAAGFTAAGPAIETDLPRDELGRLRVGADLRVPGAPEVFVAGDSAGVVPGLEFIRMACASAMPMGGHAADGIVRLSRGLQPEPYRFAYKVQCISLGRARGLVQVVDPRDRPLDRIYTGRRGAIVKELICRGVVGALRIERHFAGAFKWLTAVEAQAPASTPLLVG